MSDAARAKVIADVLECLHSWEPNVRVLGNVRAEDAWNAIESLVEQMAAMRAALDKAATALARISLLGAHEPHVCEDIADSVNFRHRWTK